MDMTEKFLKNVQFFINLVYLNYAKIEDNFDPYKKPSEPGFIHKKLIKDKNVIRSIVEAFVKVNEGLTDQNLSLSKTQNKSNFR